MKKIDLHLHTKSTKQDFDFTFSLEKLKEYITQLNIDCIAVTNHNLFDLSQFIEISDGLTIKVFPGIEINLEKGHLILISENENLEDFEKKCNKIFDLIKSPNDFIRVEELKEIYGNLSNYLLIPHYSKNPNIKQEIIDSLSEFITAGEVTSPKKFKSCIKSSNSLVPVVFSDLRFRDEMISFNSKQTYIDIDDTSLKAIKTCLLDKNKVSLSKDEGHNFFQIFENGQKLSTGLNVVLGQRSSGKSFTLKEIASTQENVKYIRQFELLEKDEEKDKKKFEQLLSNKQSGVTEEFLKEFKFVIDDMLLINRAENENKFDEYLKSLLKVAADEEKKDVYSQCILFNETKYSISENDTLKKLIKATSILINNTEHRETIKKHISKNNLVDLIIDLLETLSLKDEINRKQSWVNSIVTNIKSELQSFTSSTHIKEIDFYKLLMDKTKIQKFEQIVYKLKIERVIEKSDVRRFKIEASTKCYNGAQSLQTKSKSISTFKFAFDKYIFPIEYLDELRKIETIPKSEIYKYFIDVRYKILNEHGAEVSGGERSEFNLLEKIKNAHHYDLLLIDEPESSFDNIFLKNEVNEQIKEISKSVPVVIVTHNNTVGASIKPDYILYTKREIIDKKPVYKIFSGYPSDIKLKTVTGEEIDNYDIMISCLEAGTQAYNERNQSYEVLKN